MHACACFFLLPFVMRKWRFEHAGVTFWSLNLAPAHGRIWLPFSPAPFPQSTYICVTFDSKWVQDQDYGLILCQDGAKSLIKPLNNYLPTNPLNNSKIWKSRSKTKTQIPKHHGDCPLWLLEGALVLRLAENMANTLCFSLFLAPGTGRRWQKPSVFLCFLEPHVKQNVGFTMATPDQRPSSNSARTLQMNLFGELIVAHPK